MIPELELLMEIGRILAPSYPHLTDLIEQVEKNQARAPQPPPAEQPAADGVSPAA